MITSRGSLRAIIGAEHRTGLCENCGATLEKEFHVEKPRVRLGCGKCGGQGRLIARSVSIQAPPPPACASIRCMWQFLKEVTFCGLLSEYHMRRVHYAEKNRNRKINQKYRTGDDAPENIRQAIIGIIKIRIGGLRWHRPN